MLAELNARFDLNLSRIGNLLALYERVKKKGRGRKDVPSLDLLRAATVFLHATLEDFVRGLIVWRYPTLGPEILDTVPLKGISPSGRPEKFFLGRLAEFRALHVEEVLTQSVEAFAEGLTLNNTTDLIACVRTLGLNEASLKPYLSNIAALMKRRHHIVHQADRNAKPGRGQQSAMSIGAHTVAEWTESVTGFAAVVTAQLGKE
jgi:hypothetical protein